MALNLTLLRSFHAVVEAGSVSKASREGGASQPGLSKAVRELEKQLGVPLLERGARGTKPTQAGTELFDYARAIFALEARAEDAIKAHRSLEAATLSIGASTTIATYVLPTVLARFHALHSGISLSLWRGNSREIEARLLAYELDVALIVGAPCDERLQGTVWRGDEIVGICAPDHPLAQREIVYPDDLAQCVWVTREAGSGTRDALDAAMSPDGLSPVGRLEIGGCEALKQSVAAGLGIGFVSRQAAADQIALGKLKVMRVSDIEIRSPFYLLHLPNRPLSPAARAFEAFLLSGSTPKPAST